MCKLLSESDSFFDKIASFTTYDLKIDQKQKVAIKVFFRSLSLPMGKHFLLFTCQKYTWLNQNAQLDNVQMLF